MNGSEVLVMVDVDGAGTYVPVGSQTNASIAESNDTRDASSKNQREMKVEYGRYSGTISFEALYLPGDLAYAALKVAMRNGVKIKLREQEAGVQVEEVSAVITSMTRDFPDQDNVTISMEAAIDGPILPL